MHIYEGSSSQTVNDHCRYLHCPREEVCILGKGAAARDFRVAGKLALGQRETRLMFPRLPQAREEGTQKYFNALILCGSPAGTAGANGSVARRFLGFLRYFLEHSSAGSGHWPTLFRHRRWRSTETTLVSSSMPPPYYADKDVRN